MSTPEFIQIEKRQDRMEDAIERLTQISYDLNRMLAVQEQRISQQEKNFLNIEKVTENRREEYELKFENIYKAISEETKKIVEEIEERREASDQQIAEIKTKISGIEKIIWTYLGGFSVIVFLISYGDKILRALEKLV